MRLPATFDVTLSTLALRVATFADVAFNVATLVIAKLFASKFAVSEPPVNIPPPVAP
jgi:hypothetical protein